MLHRLHTRLAVIVPVLLALSGCSDDARGPGGETMEEAPPAFQYALGSSREGTLQYPTSIAVDADRNIYVMDEVYSYLGGPTIVKLDPNGAFVRRWPLPVGPPASSAGGATPGVAPKSETDFYGPLLNSVTISGNDVLVTDPSRSRVVRFDRDGNHIGGWGRQGSGEGEFSRIVEAAIDGEGSVYVLDGGNYRVQKFTADGTFIREWGGQGTRPGEFESTFGLAVDPEGFVYVGDRELLRVQKFNGDGDFLDEWSFRSVPGAGNIGINPVRISTDGEGQLLILFDGGRVTTWSAEGVFVKVWLAEPPDGLESYPNTYGVTSDPDGTLLTVDQGARQVFRFTSDGEWIQTLAREYGSGDGEFMNARDIGVDQRGRLYVLSDYATLSEFSPEGVFLRERTLTTEFNYYISNIFVSAAGQVRFWDGRMFHELEASGATRPMTPQPAVTESERSVTADAAGRLIVLYSGGGIETYTPGVGIGAAFSFYQPGESTRNYPWLVRGGPGGTIWVAYAEPGTGPIVVGKLITTSRRSLRIFGPGGAYRGEFKLPDSSEFADLSIGDFNFDSEGSLYILDVRDNQVLKFNRGGDLMMRWTFEAEVTPTRLVIHGSSDFYVLDQYSDRVVKYGY